MDGAGTPSSTPALVPSLDVSPSNLFRAGSFHFVINSRQRWLAERVQAVLTDLPPGDPSLAMPIEIETDGKLFSLKIEKLTETTADESSLLSSLVTLLNRRSLDANPRSLHIHAGTVARDDAAILIVAPSGGGKTTTTTALAASGWMYLSDETAEVDGQCVKAWPKPISVKPSGFGVIRRALRSDFGLDETQSAWTIAASDLGFSVASHATARTIVFLEPDDLPLSTQVSVADATVSLVQQTMDFERAGPDALQILARLAASCHLVRIARADPKEMVRRIESEAMQSNSVIASANRTIQLHSISWSSNSTLVQIGAELVVRNGTTGAVASLNAEGTRAVLRMAAAPDELSLGRDDAAFLARLKEAGLISTQSSDRTRT